MITAKAFAGKHFAVYGLARSGLATVEALLASEAKMTAWDAKLAPSPRRGEGRREGVRGSSESADTEHRHPALSLNGEGFRIADLDTADLAQFDSLVVTPGLPLNRHPIAKRAREAGLEIIGDIELFARARPELPPHKVVGITGTNGKSTTTALIHHILKTAGVPSAMGGNIGLPILAQDPLPEGGVYVLELSSYQIDLTQSLDCDVAVLLNVTPDHLDRYESFEAYTASKARLFEMQTAAHIAIWSCDDRGADQAGVEKVTSVGRYDDICEISGASAKQGQTYWPALQGPHNAQNAAAAIAACTSLGVGAGEIEQGLRSFPGLAHRMERIRDLDGVLFVNDSKATNAEATAPALAAYPRIRWILGGQAKAESLGDTAARLGHVTKAYTIGEAGPMFARLLRAAGVEVAECETLENAVNIAAGDSREGETVLLSPASASFDQFRDFEERGDLFRKLVGEL